MAPGNAVVARTAFYLKVKVGANFSVGTGVFCRYIYVAGGSIAGDAQVCAISKIVFRAQDGGVGTQGHAQRQDKCHGNNTNFFLQGDLTFSLL